MILDTVAFVRLLRSELADEVVLEFESAPVVVLSAATLFEINQKVRIGHLDMPAIGASEVEKIAARGFEVAPVTSSAMTLAGSLPWHVDGREHRDPFDRMIAALAIERKLPVATSDRAFAALPDLELLPI